MTIKIRLLGDTGVGKSTLIQAAAHQPLTEQYVSHNNMHHTVLTTVTNPLTGQPVEVMLDAGGKSANNEPANAVLLVFSLDNPQSFENLRRYVAETSPKQHSVVFIVGCKSDTSKKPNHLYQEAAQASDRPYWEVNAQTGHHIELLFQHVISCINNPANLHVSASLFEQRALKKNYQNIINKLNIEHKESYQAIAQFAEDIDFINNITKTMDDKPHHDQRRDFRIAIVKTLQKHYHQLINEWNDLEKINNEIDALKKIEQTLHIIQPKASQKNKPKAAMHEVKHLIEALTKHAKAIEEKKALDQAENDPVNAMLFLAKTPNLPNKETLRNLVKKHLMSPMLESDGKQENIAEAMKTLSNEERTQLKKQLIKATQYEIHESTNQQTDAYQRLYADKDNLKSCIPLIAILCTSGHGKIHAKTDNYITWLAAVNESKKKRTQSKSQAVSTIGLLGIAHRALTTKKQNKKNTKAAEALFSLDFEDDKPKKK